MKLIEFDKDNFINMATVVLIEKFIDEDEQNTEYTRITTVENKEIYLEQKFDEFMKNVTPKEVKSEEGYSYDGPTL